MRYRNWSDGQVRLLGGLLTYDREHHGAPMSVVLDSGHEESRCSLRLRAFGHTLIIEMPQILKPYGEFGQYSREYGFALEEGVLHFFYGPQTMDSSDTKSWGWWLPWMQWRFHRFSLYDTAGEHFWTQLQRDKPGGLGGFQLQSEKTDLCPSFTFALVDYDGEAIEAKTHIEEREWRFGEDWFTWLSIFRKPRIERCLDIDFSKEVGREKGSWKGGTVGHSTTLLPGELHESAFKRYCAEHQMTFIGPIEENQ